MVSYAGNHNSVVTNTLTLIAIFGQGVVCLSHIPHADLLWCVSPRCGNGITHLRSLASRADLSRVTSKTMTSPLGTQFYGAHIHKAPNWSSKSAHAILKAARVTPLCVDSNLQSCAKSVLRNRDFHRHKRPFAEELVTKIHPYKWNRQVQRMWNSW